LPENPHKTAPDRGMDDWDLHWSQYAEANELNPAQGFRRRLTIDSLAIDRPNARVIDIGSGTGVLAADLIAELPAPEVLGLELSATGVEIATRKVPQAEFLEWDLLSPAAPDERHREWAEYAICSEVLEHVDDPVLLIAHARAFLAGGCRLVVTVPGGPMSAFDRHIGHRRHFSRADIGRVLESAGYEVESLRAVGFPFFNLYRYAVIAAGDRLIEGERSDAGPPGPATRLVASVFRGLLAHNRGGRRLGYQTVAVAINP
jgi:SAM-dependent methyltransferase